MNIRAMLRLVTAVDRQIRKDTMRTVGSPTKRTSNKSKLKTTKKKPNVKYKSSKPVKAQVVKQFRNKSNI